MNNVLIHTRADFPYVNVQVWFLYGAGNEPHGRSGVAHLLEHVKIAQMSFSGSQLARFSLSGRTGSEIVHFEFVSPKQYLQTNLEEFFAELTSKRFSRSIVQTQKEKVINEVLYRKNMQIYRMVNMAMEAVFGDSYGNNPGGDIDTIKSASEREMAECTDKAFINGKYLLSVSGDIPPKDAEDIRDKYEKEVDIEVWKRDLKRYSPVYLQGEKEKGGLIVYRAPGKLHWYHILRVIELYIERQCLSGMPGRVMLIPMLSVSLFAFYILGEDAARNVQELQLRLRREPVREEMEKMAVLYLEMREYRMQSNPNRDMLESVLYQLAFKGAEEMAVQAVALFSDIFSAEDAYEVYAE